MKLNHRNCLEKKGYRLVINKVNTRVADIENKALEFKNVHFSVFIDFILIL